MKKILKRLTPLLRIYRFYFKKKNEFYNWYSIPSYETKRKAIIRLSKKYNFKNVFIETGTYFGDTIEYLKGHFLKLFSIELSEELAAMSAKRFQNENKISIVQGDSTQRLSDILQSIDVPCVFWLDGHYSSEFWAGDKYITTAKGEKETPVVEELKQISNHIIKNHIILIDDARLFKGKNDYPAISFLRSFVNKQLPNHSFSVKNDMIRILPKV
jgi:hypothetical protein